MSLALPQEDSNLIFLNYRKVIAYFFKANWIFNEEEVVYSSVDFLPVWSAQNPQKIPDKKLFVAPGFPKGTVSFPEGFVHGRNDVHQTCLPSLSGTVLQNFCPDPAFCLPL